MPCPHLFSPVVIRLPFKNTSLKPSAQTLVSKPRRTRAPGDVADTKSVGGGESKVNFLCKRVKKYWKTDKLCQNDIYIDRSID